MFKASLIYFLIRVVNGALALGTIYVLTRILPADQYGFYALGVAGIGLFASILFQWISVSVSRFYATHFTKPDILLNEAYRLFFGVAAMVLVAIPICAAWTPTPAVTPLLALVIGTGAIAMGFHTLAIQVANARDEPFRFGLLTASRGVLVLIGTVAFVRAGFGGVGAVLGVALANLLSVIFFAVRRQSKAPSNSPDLRRQLIAYGLPLTLTYLATVILDVSDRFLIAMWMGTSAVAGYAASYDLTQQTAGALLNVLFLVSYPKITRAWEEGRAPAARKAMLPLSRSMLIGVPLVVGIFIGLAPQISQLFFGEALRPEAANVMPWVAFAIGLSCLKSFFLDIAFQLAKETHMQLRITVAMAALNVVLNLLLMPKFGVVGAAMSTVAAFLSGAVMSWWYGRRIGVYPTVKGEVISMAFVLGALVFGTRIVPVIEGNDFLVGSVRLISGMFFFTSAVMITNLSSARSTLFNWLRIIRNKST